MQDGVLPMRFGDSQPRAPTVSRLKFQEPVDYMMDYASDEEYDGVRLPSIKGALKVEVTAAVSSPRADGEKVKKVSKKQPTVSASSKGPVRQLAVVRDRPRSAKAFKEVAANDHELRIFERHSSVRRMLLTEDAEKWLNDKEKERAKLFEEKVKKLKEDFAAKNDKKGKDGSRVSGA